MQTMVLLMSLTMFGMVAVGCGGDKGGGSDPKAVVKGFIEAVGAGDYEKAKSYLPEQMRGQVSAGQLEGVFPKGAKVKSVEPAKEKMIDAPGMNEWDVVLEVDGAEQQSGAMTMEYGGSHYIAIAIRKDKD